MHMLTAVLAHPLMLVHTYAYTHYIIVILLLLILILLITLILLLLPATYYLLPATYTSEADTHAHTDAEMRAAAPTVGSHDLNSHSFKLRLSNPRTVINKI